MIDPKLEGKVAIVTGANSPYGIGAGIAKALAAQGVKVFLNYLRLRPEHQSPVPEDAERGSTFYYHQKTKTPDEVLEAIHQLGGQAEAREADLSDPNNIPLLFDKAEAVFGSVNILVNNHAHWEADTFLPSPEDLVNKDVEAWTSAPKQITITST